MREMIESFAPARPRDHESTLATVAARLVGWLLEAIERHRQRNQLAELDDRLLRDIGLDRDDARQEAAKPFWR